MKNNGNETKNEFGRGTFSTRFHGELRVVWRLRQVCRSGRSEFTGDNR